MSTPLQVYTANTPNGVKIPIALEEIGAAYEITRINLSRNEQKQPDFLKINPNGRIPAIIDPDGPEGLLPVFESGAILFYLAEKFGALLGEGPVERINALAWTFFQVGGIGPMFGQAGFFRRGAEPNPKAVERFEVESQRLISVMDSQLTNTAFLAGDRFTIADIAHFGWLDRAEDYANATVPPAVAAWRETVRARSAVQRAMAVLVD